MSNFDIGEFPEDPIKYGDPELLRSLQHFRDLFGDYIYISPSSGALARFSDDGSQHFATTDGSTKSKAVDCFPVVRPLTLFTLALSCQLWGGIGFYFDTKFKGQNWMMMHLDIRPLGHHHSQDTVLIWYREDGKYRYPQYEEFGVDILLRKFRIILNS
jgi:hypothetical protein